MSTIDYVTIDAFAKNPGRGFFAAATIKKPAERIKKEIAEWSDANPDKRIVGIEYEQDNACYYVWHQTD